MGFCLDLTHQIPIFHIDADARNYASLKKLPEDIDSWSKSDLEDDPFLMARLINNSEEGGGILIDTGAESGIMLNEERWKNWLKEQRQTVYIASWLYFSSWSLIN